MQLKNSDFQFFEPFVDVFVLLSLSLFDILDIAFKGGSLRVDHGGKVGEPVGHDVVEFFNPFFLNFGNLLVML